MGIIRDGVEGKVYQYILASGNIAQYDWVVPASTTGYTVKASTTAETEAAAGVVQVAFTDAYYGWVQTWGLGRAKKDTDCNCAALDVLGIGTVAGCCLKRLTNDSTSGKIGVALAAATTTIVTTSVLIMCRG